VLTGETNRSAIHCTTSRAVYAAETRFIARRRPLQHESRDVCLSIRRHAVTTKQLCAVVAVKFPTKQIADKPKTKCISLRHYHKILNAKSDYLGGMKPIAKQRFVNQ